MLLIFCFNQRAKNIVFGGGCVCVPFSRDVFRVTKWQNGRRKNDIAR